MKLNTLLEKAPQCAVCTTRVVNLHVLLFFLETCGMLLEYRKHESILKKQDEQLNYIDHKIKKITLEL